MSFFAVRLRTTMSFSVSITIFALLTALFVEFASAQSNWQAEWERTLRAAEAEGQVALYGCCYDFDRVLEGFKKKYPKLKVTTILGSGNQLATRILAERRGDKFIIDVVSSGANTLHDALYKGHALEPIKPALILPEVTDQSKWYLNKHQYSDREGQYVFNYVGSATYGSISYNTKLVDVNEFKSYLDLLQPRWKGKIAIRDIREAGPGAGNTRFFYYHADLGPAFIKKLFGEMDATLFRDFRQGPDWLATGKYAICFFCDADTLKQQGLPVDTFGPRVFKEGGGLVQQFGTVTLLNRAPHPNAAKVFINWLLSRSGQIALQKRTLTGESPADSLRIDIPKDEVPLLQRRLPDIKYVDTGKPEWIEMKPIIDVVNEALRSAGKN